MINLQTFLLGLLVVSTLTSLFTEAVKSVLTEHNKKYYANTLAGAIAMVLSVGVGIGYIFTTNIGFTTNSIVCLVALTLMSWLCAMIGYDKVVQAISQFKTNTKGDE